LAEVHRFARQEAWAWGFERVAQRNGAEPRGLEIALMFDPNKLNDKPVTIVYVETLDKYKAEIDRYFVESQRLRCALRELRDAVTEQGDCFKDPESFIMAAVGRADAILEVK
jgi:hypothetical protein